MTKVLEKTGDQTIDLALDTVGLGKQAIIFANTKASAEATAEKISLKVKGLLDDLSEKILHSLSRPTKQCERLAKIVRKGVAFHHAGLTTEQRMLIEDTFRTGEIKIICATPTLAAGVDLPAFRTILKDLKRFTFRGLNWIPVLEYEQMAGRAGRPSYDTVGEAIVIAKSQVDKDEIEERYVYGEVEDVLSKLAVEPVLRTYLLSLIASSFCVDKKGLLEFFSKTFWAFQFKDMFKLEAIIDKILSQLQDWGFILIDKNGKAKDFVSALDFSESKLEATAIGKRVAELYVDPYTANFLITGLNRGKEKMVSEVEAFSFLQLVCHCLEMRPLLRTRTKEFEDVAAKIVENSSCLLEPEPAVFDPEYNEYIDSVKTAMFFQDWIDENGEEVILEKYNVRPGEIKVKLDRGDWLLYCMEEFARMMKYQAVLKEVSKTRFRVKYGAKEELFALLKLKDIGRVRARKLFRHGITNLGDVKKVQLDQLVAVIGAKTAASIKEQCGIVVDRSKLVIKKGTRKGQLSLNKFSK